MSVMNELRMEIALDEIPVSGWTCRTIRGLRQVQLLWRNGYYAAVQCTVIQLFFELHEHYPRTVSYTRKY